MTTPYLPTLLFILSWFRQVEGIVNLKTGMVTSSSSVHPPYYPSKAVDGLYGWNPLSNCFVSANSQKSIAWWRGDIGYVARIINIDIQFRGGTGRQDGYFLYVSKTPSWTDGRLCYHDDDPDVIPDVIQNRTCEVDGRYVILLVLSDSNPFVEICEIDVYGCRSNFYGEKCESPCYCRQGCNATSGICDTPECQPGWKGIRCDAKCGPHRFGANCSQVCHCRESECHHITGHCHKPTCLPGYYGGSCSQVCAKGNFGADCSQQCHCKNSGCSHVTGTCKAPGCSRGWSGSTCSEACGPGTFGEDCNQTCHCDVTGCNPFIGSCYEPGCKKGWSGDSCDVKSNNDNETALDDCNFQTFGKNCSQICNCEVGDCDHVTGTCMKPECMPGWRGAACDQKCETGTFGYNCTNKCHCLYPGCNHSNGTCFRKEVICQDGWMGDSCDIACPEGNFGTRCSKTCHCQFPGCNHVTGTCDNVTEGCLDGWEGDACDKAKDAAKVFPNSQELLTAINELVHLCSDNQDLLKGIRESVNTCPDTQDLLKGIRESVHTCPDTKDLLTAVKDSVHVCPNTRDYGTAILLCVVLGILLSVAGNIITLMLLARRSCCKKKQDMYILDGGIENKTYDELNLPRNDESSCSAT